MNCLLILSLAVLGASASPCGLNVVSGIGCGNVVSGIGFGNAVSGIGFGNAVSEIGTVATQGSTSALPGRTLLAQTPVIENPTAVFPAILPSTSVSQACHCMKTLVRPQIRNEVITVPSVDRVVRVVTSPVLEVSSVNCGGNTRNFQVPTYNSFEGVSTGVVGGSFPALVSGGYQGVIGGCSQGFGGVINTGIAGNAGCGCNVIA